MKTMYYSIFGLTAAALLTATMAYATDISGVIINSSGYVDVQVAEAKPGLPKSIPAQGQRDYKLHLEPNQSQVVVYKGIGNYYDTQGCVFLFSTDSMGGVKVEAAALDGSAGWGNSPCQSMGDKGQALVIHVGS